MRSAVETVNPTRVKLTVEVPFEELKPSVDAAYKRIGAQVTIPGFRKGKVPARLIDQRFGRALVLEEAVNEALPRLYTQAVQDSGVQALGQPEVDVTRFADGEALEFTAEVDVRPDVELPDYTDLEVVVDDADVTDAEVDEEIEALRARFGVLRAVDRAVERGDFVSLDLSAAVDDEPLEGASAKGLSYEVGSNSLFEGLDDAIVGLTAGQSTTFSTRLAGGEHVGEDAEVRVTLQSVKERELPELDDEFAQTASEFDTLEELRADLRSRLERLKRLQQAMQARDRALEALLAGVDVPLPERVVQDEIESRHHEIAHQLEVAELSKADYLAGEGQSEEDFDADIARHARAAVKAQFVLDAVAAKERLSVNEQELSEHIARRAQRVGIAPDEYARRVVKAGQVSVLVSEVVRGKALAAVLNAARVVDTSGRPVDLELLREDTPPAAE